MKSGTMDKHRGCILLKSEENEQVFQLIGNRCQCLAAGVVQLYLTEPPYHKEWIKKNTGIITLIRDNPKRSYFLRLYCLQRKAMLWEQELYTSMDYKVPLSYFHTFEADDCMAAFNFANETEAATLRNIVLQKLNAKHQRRQQRKKMETEGQHGATLPWRSQSNSPMAYNTGSTSNLLNGAPASLGVNRSASSSSMYKTEKKKKDRTKRKITKDDIGLPSNFRHLTHVGLHPNSKGRDLELEDPLLKQFLAEAGVSDRDINDQNTRDFIYNFIEKNGGMNAIRLETSSPSGMKAISQPPVPPQRQEYPPPVPARTHQTRSAPPLPPSRFSAPSTPPSAPASAPPVHRTLPTRPPPPTLTSAPPLPPPPPPPPAPRSQNNSAAPVPPPPPLPNLVSTDNGDTNANATNNNNNNNNEDAVDPRSMLMESIRSGTTLKKVDKTEPKPPPPPATDTRSALLQQIREGIELKRVTNEVKSKTSTPAIRDGLASALSRALAERSSAIHSDSEDSTSDTSEEDEWDD